MTGLLLLGSVFLESYLSYTQYTRDLERQSSVKVQQIIEQVALNIDTYLDDLYRLTLFPYRNAAIMKALEEEGDRSELGQLEKRRLIEGFLDEALIYPRKDILRVSIMTDSIYSSARLPSSLVPNEDVESYDWYKRALSSQEYIFVPASAQPAGEGNVPVFSIVKQLRSITDTQTIIGVIKADANYNGIADIAGRVQMGEDGGLFILDDNNHFVYSSDDSFRETVLSALDKGEDAHGEYLLNRAEITRIGWSIVAVNSVAEMKRGAVQTRNTAFLFAIGSAMFGIAVLVFLIRKFLAPLLSVVKLMKEVEHGRLDVAFRSDRQDEMGYLGSAFNRLVGKIDGMLSENTRLVKEVYESKLLQQEAQINALYSQIRPHFLFNTLNLISLTMQSGEQDKAITHINRLSSILRSMSQWGKEIPLGKEVELLHAYLGIQSSRYDGRLSYTIDVAASMHGIDVPALLLQPIVENAVVHACERQKSQTTISVRARIEAELFVIEVRDDGPGMDERTLTDLRHKVDGLRDSDGGNAAHAGIGLVNVNKRLKAKYGAAFGLRIDSAPGQGTIVTVTMPAPGEKEDGDV